MLSAADITAATGLNVYAGSPVEAGEATYFLARRGAEKVVGCAGSPCLPNVQKIGQIGGLCVCAGPADSTNAAAVRAALPWAAPHCVGLATSIGLGDRLGLATPGHIRAVRGTGLAAVLAQQSIREMARTGRTPRQVMDAATWGILQEGFRDGFGADADHLQKPEDVDVTAAAGFTMFTIDPGAHVVDAADTLPVGELARRFASLDFDALGVTPGEIKRMYLAKSFALSGGGRIDFEEASFLRAAVKYGAAVAHAVRMHRRLTERAGGAFELEVSVDETATPTRPAEHFFIASELHRLGVAFVSLAPRFVGRFEKGVDYIGDLGEFRRSFAEHVAVMRTLGPYKLSIHSGSDKFSIYPIAAELAEGMVHVKTAGTSYLEALRTISRTDPPLFREVLDFARGRYQTDKATYHVSADVSKVPASSGLRDEEPPGLLEDFHARQVLHVTFGSVMTETDRGLGRRILVALAEREDAYFSALEKHLGRHAEPFRRTRQTRASRGAGPRE